ncbi:MAG: serine--tRNA ligase [Chloroflexi bacterium]|nr:serine--tRNA ligase [Chloroflexota bacterium]
MLAPSLIRDHPERVRRALSRRHDPGPLDDLLALDASRRELLQESQTLRQERNTINEAVKTAGRPTDDQRRRMRALAERLREVETKLNETEGSFNDLLLRVPNIPHETVPEGRDAAENVEVRRWGQAPAIPCAPRPHWELGVSLSIVDFDRGVKLAGSRFYVLKGLGARLQRALIAFFLDRHVEQQGYTEMGLPYLIRSAAMQGSGKLPKFADDSYYLEQDDLWLNPTAEVPLTDLHRDEILDGTLLPLRYTAYCPSWRREAGAAGRDTRGLIRVHQFHKVEMYAFTRPEDSYDEFQRMVGHAEELLQALGLHYRVLRLCTGDLGFAATDTYDLEVWLPAAMEFREISSVSNCEDFQARRASIRFRRAPGERLEFVHTLNGSGLPIDRTIAAILENGQQPDGSIVLPKVLQPYMGTEIIAPEN